MKNYLLFLTLILSCATAEPIPTIHFDPSAEVTIRRAAMKSIAIKTPRNAPPDVLSVAEAGLSDPDAKVREHALAIIFRMAVAPQYYPGTKKIDLAESAPLKDHLLNLIEDQDEKVRQIAIDTIGVSLDPSPELEILFIERFKKETSGGNRKRIIQCLAHHEYDSPQTISLLCDALSDKYSGVKTDASKRIAQIKPHAALPLLIQGMRTEVLPVREQFSRAIKAYGQNAVPYLQQLEQMKEQADDEFRELLDETIKGARKEEANSVND